MKFINHQHHHDKLLSLYYNNVSQVQGFSLQSDSLLVTTKDKNLWVSTIFQCTLSWEEEEETSRLGSNSSLSDRTIYGHDGGGGGGGSCTAESYSQCWREKTSKASSWFLAMPKWISSNSSRLFDSNKKTSKYSSPHNHSFFSSEKKLDWPVFSMDETLKCGSFWRNNTLDGQKNNMIWSFECQVRYIKPIKSKKEDFFVTFFEWQLL